MRAGASLFVRFAQWACHVTGAPVSFLIAVAVIVVWAISGPFFGFSDTWQLVINTGTTIVTFLMVFVIQSTQNRDTAALHIKLDELILVSRKARNKMLDLDSLGEKDLDKLKEDYAKLAQEEIPEALKERRQDASAKRGKSRKRQSAK
jgi:low affinity Fe/Cu permease